MVYLENTPDLIQKDMQGREYIDIFIHTKKANAKGRLYRNSMTMVLQGSKIQDPVPSFKEKDIKPEYYTHCKDNIVHTQCSFKTPTGAANLVLGNHRSGWTEWKNKYNKGIEIYRYKNTNQQQLQAQSIYEKVQSSPTYTVPTIQAQAVVLPPKTVTQEVQLQGQDYKHYKLNEYHTNKIGKQLKYNGEVFCKIISNTDIEVNGQSFDISKYIHDHNLDTTKIKFGSVIRFDTLYEEV
jgi:hypothetical protein